MLENKKKVSSWFWKWFLNNKFVTSLLVILLMLLILMSFTKVSYLFTPILQFFGIVGIPIVIATVLYYFLVPVVDLFEKHRVKRVITIAVLFVVILGLIIWGAIVAVPKIEDQILRFVSNLPSYFEEISRQSEKMLSNKWIVDFKPQIDSVAENGLDSLANIFKDFFRDSLDSIRSLVGAVANIFVAILTVPFLLFYLLKDGKKLPHYFASFLPTKHRKITLQVLGEMNEKVSQYIRGQLTVAVIVAILFSIGLSIIGLDFAITLGVIAGLLNLIPYLGSFLAMIPAIFLALVVGPGMLVKVLIVFFIEQMIEGRVISPLVLGSQLNIHPVTIIFVLLTSGKIFGVIGVILGIPVYAALKVLTTYIFEWYKNVSKLY